MDPGGVSQAGGRRANFAYHEVMRCRGARPEGGGRIFRAVAGLVAIGAGLLPGGAGADDEVAAMPSSPYQGVTYGHVDVALPGPGVVSARGQWRGSRSQFEHRISSSVRLREPVRLWLGNSYGAEKVEVNVEARGGGPRSVPVEQLGTASPALFLGTPDDLAALEKLLLAVSTVTEEKPDGKGALSGLQVLAADVTAADPCETLLRAPRAIVVRWDDRVALPDCAARGATVLAVGRAVAGSLAGGEAGGKPAASAGLPSGAFWPHGAGFFAWAEDLPGAAGLLARNAFPPRNQYEGNWNNPSRSYWPLQHELAVAPDADQGHLRSGGAVYLTLALFVAYVLAAVVAGIVVSRRPRRPWVTWAWFPGLAGVVTLGLVLFGRGWTGTAGRASAGQLLLVAPSGVGNATRWVHLFGERSVAFEVEAPFARGIPLHFSRGHRFGSPLISAVGPIRLDENADRGVLRFSGLTVNRRGDAEVGWFEPVQVPIARVARVAGGVEIENRAGAALQDVVFCLPPPAAGKILARPVGRLAAGAKTVVADSRSNDGINLLNGLSEACANVPGGGFVLIGRLTEPVGGGLEGVAGWAERVRVFPSVPVTTKTLFVVVGALPPEPAALGAMPAEEPTP